MQVAEVLRRNMFNISTYQKSMMCSSTEMQRDDLFLIKLLLLQDCNDHIPVVMNHVLYKESQGRTIPLNFQQKSNLTEFCLTCVSFLQLPGLWSPPTLLLTLITVIWRKAGWSRWLIRLLVVLGVCSGSGFDPVALLGSCQRC